jgi:putative flippase GtrA
MKALYDKYKDVIPYLFFGVCTTLVNIAVYWLCAHPFGFGVMPSTIIAWIAAVLFAYLTNRKWVFHSEAVGLKSVCAEIVAFFGCRLATGILDWLMMFVFVDYLHFNDVVIKAVANVVVIILNYVASKVVIFKKKEKVEDEKVS